MGTDRARHRDWRRTLRRAALPVSGVLLALALASCGGGEGEPSAPAAPGPGPGGEAASTESAPAAYTLADGGRTLVSRGGKRISVQPNAITGFVDSVIPEGGIINVTGWAAAPGLSGPAKRVVGVVAGRSIGEAVPSSKRPDVVEAYGHPAIEASGFTLFIETSSLSCSDPAGGLTVVGIAAKTATPLPLVGDSEKELDGAC